MQKPDINDDDYCALEHEHASALRDLENLTIGDFAAEGILIRIQDHAYALGLARGRKEAEGSV